MAALSLVLAGCTKVTVTPEADGPWGHIAARPGRPGFVVAAPHGTSDIATDLIAAEVASRTGFGVVIATGFSIAADSREGAGRRFQVNRPLEGTPGRPPAEEVPSARARQVYEAYESRVRTAAAGPLLFYAEIHGNNHREVADRIEVATVGVDGETALRVRTLFELVRDVHLRAAPGAPRLTIVVEGEDTVRYRASGAKRDGILRVPERALHIELPKSVRTEWRAVYTVILADFIGQAAILPPVR